MMVHCGCCKALLTCLAGLAVYVVVHAATMVQGVGLTTCATIALLFCLQAVKLHPHGLLCWDLSSG